MMAVNTQIQATLNLLIPELFALKKAGNQKVFNERLLTMLPEVELYIKQAINAAVSSGILPENSVETEDILDQLYLTAFKHLDELDDPELFNSWLLLQAEHVLQDQIDDQEFHRLFVANIEDYTHREWDELEEKYSVDGGGDFVMMDELDDPSYNREDFTLDKIFTEAADENIINRLDEKLSKEQKARHLQLVMDNMSLPVRTSIRLSVWHKRTPKEIARLRHESLDKVNDHLAQGLRIIKQSYTRRYLS